MMTIKDVAAKLNGREYGSEVSAVEQIEFKNAGIVVVYGYSDDCVEFEGAVNTEIGIWNAGYIPLLNGVPFDMDCSTEVIKASGCLTLKDVSKRLKHIKAKFGMNGWEFDAEFPHEKFSIVERECDNPCSEGLVYSLADLMEVQEDGCCKAD